MSNLIYPWLQDSWNQLSQIPKAQFPHALIITGSEGIGKLEFCLQINQSLLCSNLSEEGSPCAKCSSCAQFLAQSHGDYLILEVVEGKKLIGVDQIREMINWVNLTHQSKQKKVLFIPQAEKMTLAAANALLKTLEEPPADVVIILVCEHLNSLLATIRSRCQIVRLAKPTPAVMEQWLDNNQADWKLLPENENLLSNHRDLLFSLAFYSPLKVKQLLTSDALVKRKTIISQLISIIIDDNSPVIVASGLFKNDSEVTMYWLQAILFDLIYMHYHVDNFKLINTDYYEDIQLLSDKLNTLLIFELINELKEYYQYKDRSLNAQLMLESYLIKWQECCLKK
jgi:DNA polymerase III subunit delta'